MAALAFPTGDNYKSENLGSINRLYFTFASVADADTFTVPSALVRAIQFASGHTSAVSFSAVKGTVTNAGTPLTLHVSATGAGTLIVDCK